MKLKHHNNVACVCVCWCVVFTYFVLFCCVWCFVLLTYLCVCWMTLHWFLGFLHWLPWLFCGTFGSLVSVEPSWKASYGKMEQDGPPEAGFGRKVRGFQGGIC